jgi:hypothetical protein
MVTCSEVYRGRLSKTIIRKLGWEFQNPNLATLKVLTMLIDYPADSDFVHEASYEIKNPKGEIIFSGKLETDTDFHTVMKTLGIKVQEVRWSKD